MTHPDNLAKQLAALHGGETPNPECFDTLYRLIFELRHLPQSTVPALEDPSRFGNLPIDQAEILLELVTEAGPRYASTSLFMEISNTLGPTVRLVTASGDGKTFVSTLNRVSDNSD